MSEVTSDSGLLDEKLCSTLISSLRGIVWEADPLTFRFFFVSPHAERILGYPVQQWINEPDFWRNHTHPDDVAWCSDYCRDASLKGEDHEFQYRMIAADGRIVWLQDIVTVVRMDDGALRLRGIMIDITRNRMTEEKLRSEEERFHLAMQGANDGLWDWNLLTDEVYFSTRWKSMLGYAEEELENHLNTWERLVHPDDRDATVTMVRDFLDGRLEKFEIEFRMRHKSGHYLTILSRGILSRDAHGKAVRLVGTHVDITERKKAEGALRESEERLRAIFDTSQAGIIMIDLDGRISFANNSMAEMLSCPLAELIGSPYQDHLHPEERNTGHNLVNQLIEMEIDRTATERHYLRCDGSDFWGYVTGTRLKTESGAKKSLIAMVTDITERKKAEQRLKASEERYSILFNNIHDAVIIHDLNGRVLDVNQTMLDMYGVSMEEILKMGITEDLSGPGNPLEMISEIWSGVLEGKYLCFEWNARRPHNGSCFPVEVCLRRISIGDGELILANVRDMTERRRLLDEMIKSQKLESLGMLAGGIAHDFNNILTAILGNLSFVRLQLDPAHLFSKRLEECEKAVSRASELTRQLLTFSRGGEPIKKLLSPAALIGDAASFALRGSNVKCVTELADDLWCLDADEGQLCQVLHNLMLNAAQAMQNGGEVRVRAVNELLGRDNPLKLQPGAYITITVVDQGCGIPAKNLIRIFDPYFTTKPKGSGLGLASAYSIVKKHGGVLEVSSIVGEGSTFTVRLPASRDKYPAEKKDKIKPQTAGSGRILIMDDDEMICEITTEILELLGYGVESCADGLEAVERFRSARESKNPFSAVILDLTIPGGMGGKQVAPLILEIDPEAVLIVSSGYSNDPVIANYRDHGFSGVINKPFDANKLGNELEKLLKVSGKNSRS